MSPIVQPDIKLLVVDDVAQNLVAITALLARPGLTVLTAQSGTEALERLLVDEVAVALVDVQMPGMDGFELAELIRGTERTRHTPLIFLTAGASDPNRAFRGYEAGAVDFLHKPIDPRTPRLFQIAAENGLSSHYVALMQAVQEEAERVSGKSLPINATGAIGAIAAEFGFPWKIIRGFGVMARAIGLVGHILEEIDDPMAVEIWQRVEKEAGGPRRD